MGDTMKTILTAASIVIFALLNLNGCSQSPNERVDWDKKVGKDQINGAELVVTDGLATIRHFEEGKITLWAQAPSLEIDLSLKSAGDWTVQVLNAMPTSEMVVEAADDSRFVERSEVLRPTAISWEIALDAGENTLFITPPDAAVLEPYRYAVLSDIQDDIDNFHEMIAILNEDTELRFVVSTGDLVSQGERSQLERFQSEIEALNIPWYSTVGNHELIMYEPQDWAELYGRTSFHFDFKGVAFSFIDSASTTIAPAVYDSFDEWGEDARDQVHFVITHVPALDPFGLRNGSFASRNEAAKFIVALAEQAIDAVFYGHIHSYYAFSQGGVEAYISGGGGAIPEAFDGIGRHFLSVDVDPRSQVFEVATVRCD